MHTEYDQLGQFLGGLSPPALKGRGAGAPAPLVPTRLRQWRQHLHCCSPFCSLSFNLVRFSTHLLKRLANSNYLLILALYIDSFCTVSASPKDFEQSCCSIIIVPCLVSDQHHAQAAGSHSALSCPSITSQFLASSAPLPCHSQAT